jgi:four helix bundle protein
MSNLTSLRVYHQARPACAAAYRLANGITADAALRDQMRRAAVSVVLNIAEGRGRSTDADFARFLVIARGSNTELVAQLALATDLGLVPAAPAQAVMADLDAAGRMLSALIRRLKAG